MHKIDKPTAKAIKVLADSLNPFTYSTTTKVKMSGADLLLTGHAKTIVDGKPIDPKQEYLIPVPVNGHPVNHERRIRHAYQANGKEGINAYINKLVKNIKAQSND